MNLFDALVAILPVPLFGAAYLVFLEDGRKSRVWRAFRRLAR